MAEPRPRPTILPPPPSIGPRVSLDESITNMTCQSAAAASLTRHLCPIAAARLCVRANAAGRLRVRCNSVALVAVDLHGIQVLSACKGWLTLRECNSISVYYASPCCWRCKGLLLNSKNRENIRRQLEGQVAVEGSRKRGDRTNTCIWAAAQRSRQSEERLQRNPIQPAACKQLL
jgi:hypothetical protein